MLPYTIIIGLETHVQLLTETKLFCGCGTIFGQPPNTQICPVCLGLPGALPVINREAYYLAVKAACALNCEISRNTKWDRKNYYYPDLPKGFQTSQFDYPVGVGGHLTITDPADAEKQREVGLFRVHLEEDAGKSMHDEEADKKSNMQSTRIDLNRAGMPLLEIVSKPDMRSPEEAYSYLTELKLLLMYIGVSDCNMQEGSLRCDANINLHIAPSPSNRLKEVLKTPIIEIKNLNSFRAVRAALAYETNRQYQCFLDGEYVGDFAKQTWLWDEAKQITRQMRTKEESSDYRYFPEPDLLPVIITDKEVAEVQKSIEYRKPPDVRKRLTEQYLLSAYDADVIVNAGWEVAEYFFTLAKKSGNAKQSANWLTQEVMRILNQQNIPIAEFPLSAETLAKLIAAIDTGKIPRNQAKAFFAEMLKSQESVETLIQKLGVVSIPQEELDKIAEQIIAENPNIIAEILQGKAKAIGSLIGKAKKLNKNIDPALFEACLKAKINAG
ncbi:MAG: Asp-tRNA(Asn)/Glu-tRNA(Gln) amidotransferase subunit GatB [Planctomycetaceae bacterium]|jgi:aspartyl-tRNA(Asn)/glutamyl-tRNA(Gln) amidotransferase subunit B|nr:Asp-tRNA(Asn)/Glu-tRNA(Gln) amidotransferase subunit GatB [Planctomycetaceae bacterium]